MHLFNSHNVLSYIIDNLMIFFANEKNVAQAGIIYGMICSVVDNKNKLITNPLLSLLEIGGTGLCYGIGTYFISYLFNEHIRFIIPIILGLSAAQYVYNKY